MSSGEKSENEENKVENNGDITDGKANNKII